MSKKTFNKIKTIQELPKIIEKNRKKGEKIVQCHGVFDLVHLGHIRHFKQAKREGDILVVTITADKFVKRGPGRPMFNEKLRAETLSSLEVVDYVSIIHQATATFCIKTLKPDVYVKGSEYKKKGDDVTGKIYEEEEAIKSVGGKLVFTEDITFSSSKLINDHLDVYPSKIVRYLKSISTKYTSKYISREIAALGKLKVLIIGDAIIDQYHYCTPMGKSSKEHLVANKYKSSEMFAGGALATANNIASVCSKVDLLTVLGHKQSHKEFINKHLSENVKPSFFHRAGAGTIVKRRYVSAGTNRKLFEICYLKEEDISQELEKKILDHLSKKMKEYDLVVVSDFGHGLMTKNIIKFICKKSKYLALNVQTNSANIGFNLVTKYPKADCVCVDEMELRFATHDKFGDIKTHLKEINNKMSCKHTIATRGADGAVCYSSASKFSEAPALAYRVVDAIGAGDAFFAFVAPCFASGMPQDLVTFIGNAVGSIAVQIVCNREPVKSVDLMKFIMRLLK